MELVQLCIENLDFIQCKVLTVNESTLQYLLENAKHFYSVEVLKKIV